MDRLQKALEFANYRQTLNNQIQKEKLKAEGRLSVSMNGGTFKVNQELICFLDFLVRNEHISATIFDANNNPISINDVPAFLKDVTTLYFEVSNDFLQEYQRIRTMRNIKSILEIEVDK
jgi:hypothetical protein